jgi:hypothetical protein
MVIELDDVVEAHRRAVARGLPIHQGLAHQSWGHTSFCAREPNGLSLYFFSHGWKAGDDARPGS